MVYDISPALDERIPVWPGDTAFRLEPSSSIADGASVNLAALHTTCHLGSHVDAPLHVVDSGADVASLALEPFLGPCRLIELPAPPLVTAEHLDALALDDPPRLLIRTASVADRSRFPRRFSALDPEAARLLARRGCRLIGLDTPSVDPFDSKTLAAHHRLVAGGVAILEGLELEGVPAGRYELIALPLRLAGADASPVRAVLRASAG